MTSQQWSELDIISLLARASQNEVQTEHLVKGIGDDCAILSFDDSKDWIITSDMLVDTIHFDTSWHPPFQLGRKCIAVNFSDIAAMGGSPKFSLLSICLPGKCQRQWLDEWVRGATSLLKEFDCRLIGGDTVRGEKFIVNVTIIGTVEKGKALMRSKAGLNESIWVSGMLGSAAAGLLYFQSPDLGSPLDKNVFEPLLQQHLDPQPDLVLGAALACSGLVTAMQDISDGLATDLAHICLQSGVGAIIEAGLLPCHENFRAACSILGRDPLDLQISGGDDYHLVFTARQDAEQALLDLTRDCAGAEIYRIGKTISGQGVHLKSENGVRDISFSGFEHRG